MPYVKYVFINTCLTHWTLSSPFGTLQVEWCCLIWKGWCVGSQHDLSRRVAQGGNPPYPNDRTLPFNRWRKKSHIMWQWYLETSVIHQGFPWDRKVRLYLRIGLEAFQLSQNVFFLPSRLQNIYKYAHWAVRNQRSIIECFQWSTGNRIHCLRDRLLFHCYYLLSSVQLQPQQLELKQQENFNSGLRIGLMLNWYCFLIQRKDAHFYLNGCVAGVIQNSYCSSLKIHSQLSPPWLQPNTEPSPSNSIAYSSPIRGLQLEMHVSVGAVCTFAGGWKI